MLVPAMTPCPCGFFGDPKRACRCTPNQVNHYRSRISGPLLDRIDLHIPVPAVAFRELAAADGGEGSAELRARVLKARALQNARFQRGRIHANAHMTPRLVKQHCALTPDSHRLLEAAMERLGLSVPAPAPRGGASLGAKPCPEKFGIMPGAHHAVPLQQNMRYSWGHGEPCPLITFR